MRILKPQSSSVTTQPKNDDGNRQEVVDIAWELVHTIPHDITAFTQGLEIDPLRPRTALESTGLYGQSELRRIFIGDADPDAPAGFYDREPGSVISRMPLPDNVFGEGLTIDSEDQRTCIVLTWREGVAFRRSIDSLGPAFSGPSSFSYTGQGWGLAHDTDAGQLLMTDGSGVMQLRDPVTFALQGTLATQPPVERINELEYGGARPSFLGGRGAYDGISGSDIGGGGGGTTPRGFAWANVWQTPRVVAISLEDGRVLGEMDLSPLVERARQKRQTGGNGPMDVRNDVLNGIAKDPRDPTLLWITGKRWPLMFAIRVVGQ